jgi:two-component system, chemotaxis family, chemotaxis protein CheY
LSICVLIVDDSTATRMVIERIVRIADPDIGSCLHAPNGVKGLELLQSNKVDLVFTDVHMPEMNGREFLRQMRANDSWSHIPVAIVTSECSDESEVELVELGASFFHKKPLTPESLFEVFAALREKMP